MIENSVGCITHYNPKHLQLREDFLQICVHHVSLFVEKQKPKEEPNVECMAMILRVLETLTDYHREIWQSRAVYAQSRGRQSPPFPAEIPLELSYSAINNLIYHAFSERTIGKAIAMLLQLGFIKRIQEKKNDNPFYTLCTDVIQQALRQYAQQQCSPMEEHTISGSNFAASDSNFAASDSNFAASDSNFAISGSNFATNNIVNNIVTNTDDKTTNTTAQFVELSSDVAIPITEAPIRSAISLEQPPRTPRPTAQLPSTPGPLEQVPEPSPFQLSPEGEIVYQRWCAVFGDLPFERKPALLAACEKLVPFHLTEDELRSLICYMRENDTKGYYKKRGIKLWDLPGQYPGWASIHRPVAAPPPPQTSSRKNLSDIMREVRKKYE